MWQVFLCSKLHATIKIVYLQKDMIDRSQIVEKIRQVVNAVNPTAETILYGSQARGSARADSDVDLLILLDGDGEKPSIAQEETITWPLYELELQTGIQISPLVMLKKPWYNRPIKTPFYYNVLREGMKL
jgi:DNA polymerase sigma